MNLLTEPIGVTHYLVVGACLFVTGVVCMATKRNALGILMGIELVKDLLSRHIRHTQSPVAARLLVAWEATQRLFVKVMPRDYKRVLQAIKKAEESGMSVDEAVMASVHN